MTPSELPDHPQDPAGAASAPAPDDPAAVEPQPQPDSQPETAGPAPRSRSAAVAGFAAAGEWLVRAAGDLRHNLASAGLLLLLRPRDSGHWRTGGGPLLQLLVLHLLIGLGYDLYATGWRDGHFDAYALPPVSFWALALLLGAAVLVSLGRRPPDGGGAAAGAGPSVLALGSAGFALACWESLAASLLAVAADHNSALDRMYPVLSWFPLLWVAFAYALAALRLAGGPDAAEGGASPTARRTLVFLLAAALIVVPQWVVDPAARLWTGEAAEDSAGGGGPDSPQGEQALYGQFDLLNDALDAIVPGQQGVTELFTISFAGDGGQDVFLNEAVGADAVLADVFDSGEHSLVLANSVARPRERPFATVTALERSIAEVADRMNLDEDVLAIFLTSHGTPDHHLSVSLPPYAFDDLTPERLRGMLDEAGIRFRVIIVSSCYAGGFLGPLSGPDTMVITASAPERTSFGCRDGEQWTDFGRAYFAEALSQAASFEGAFRIARGRIAEREAREGLTPSDPQIFVGPGIREQLQRLETRRGGRILFAGTPRRPALEPSISRQG